GARAFAALAGPLAKVKESINLAAEMEMTEAAFETLLGSVEKGQQMVQKLTRFAAETPLSMPGNQSTTKMLLQFQVPAEEIVPWMRQLGDAASGNQERMSRLALAYGQMRAASRVTTEELNQMRDAGFSPLDEMAKITNKTMGQLREEISEGKIPFSIMN